MNKIISVVIPVYNSGAILDQLYSRLENVLDQLTEKWELILVDDASIDDTYSKMLDLRSKNDNIKLIRFAKNTGQHHATLCGIQHTKGNFIITMDDDLQNPPEEISKFIDKMMEGYDIVIGDIRGTKKHNFMRNLASSWIQGLVGLILSKPKDLYLSSFRGLTKKAASRMSTFRGHHVYLPAIMFESVPLSNICNICTQHSPRLKGKSTYTTRKLFILFSYLLVNHSRIPLRFVTIWGFILSIASFSYAFFVFIKSILFGISSHGWPSLAILISFLSGNILICMGILGEYIGRLIEETNKTNQFPIFEEHLE